jgi:tRNA (guanine37-N1)-methyltransferase
MRVPEVLLSGHHEAIRRWRREQSLHITSLRRPDLFARAAVSDQERALLESVVLPSPGEDGPRVTIP